MSMQTDFRALDKNFKSRVEASFANQPLMGFIGAKLAIIEPGFCEIHLPYRFELTQQHGFFHAGIIGTIADNCGGYAAFSLMPAESSVLTVEYKINLLSPGDGSLLIGRGKVKKAGKNLTICVVDVFVVKGGVEKLCATVQMTVMTMHEMMDKPVDTKA